MGVVQIALILAAFLCSLVAGFLFAFAIVIMPGIGSLNDREFLRAFQVMDRVIQNNQRWTPSTGQLIDVAKWNLLRYIPVKMRGAEDDKEETAKPFASL